MTFPGPHLTCPKCKKIGFKMRDVWDMNSRTEGGRVIQPGLMSELIRQVKQQAVEIARGCRDYGGGYRADDDKLAIYHHGMDTVERCLQAWANGEDSLQLRVVQSLGKENVCDSYPVCVHRQSGKACPQSTVSAEAGEARGE